MAETWTYQIRVDGSPTLMPQNHETYSKVYIKRVSPASVGNTAMYSLAGSTGSLISDASVWVYIANTTLTFGSYGTTSALSKTSSYTSLSGVTLSGIPSSILNVGTSETSLVMSCYRPGSGNGIGMKNTVFTLSVQVNQTIAKSTAVVPDNIYFGASGSVSISNPAISSVSHKISWYMTDYPSYGDNVTRDVGVSTATITIPTAWASVISTSSYANCTVTVETFYNGNSIGSNSYSTKLNISDGSKPTINSFSAQIYNDQSKNKFATNNRIYLQGMTGVRLDASATPTTGATITSYSMSATHGSYTKSGTSTFYTNVLNTSGTVTFTLTVQDSRGRTATATTSINVVAYAKPMITQGTAFRCTESGTPSENGTYAIIKAAATITNISVGSVQNGLTLSSSYYRATAGTPSVTSAVSGMQNGEAYKIGGSLDPNYQYYVRFTATDSVGGVTETDVSMTSASYAIHVRNGGLGIAFGKTSEEEGVFQITENWEPKWGNYKMPAIIVSSTQPSRNPPSGQVGVLWLKPKN